MADAINDRALGASASLHVRRMNGHQLPIARYALEFVCSSIVELCARSGNEIRDGSRHQDLIGLGQCRDTGRQMNGDAAYVLTSHFDLTGVQAGSGCKAGGVESLEQLDGALDPT
ncbi:MAG TPA: hypothetical protein VGR90_07290, partial [Acidimicrobiales bacterium]|nr:hypothetical protein [Acidimicrobiales bacterium]